MDDDEGTGGYPSDEPRRRLCDHCGDLVRNLGTHRCSVPEPATAAPQPSQYTVRLYHPSERPAVVTRCDWCGGMVVDIAAHQCPMRPPLALFGDDVHVRASPKPTSDAEQMRWCNWCNALAFPSTHACLARPSTPEVRAGLKLTSVTDPEYADPPPAPPATFSCGACGETYPPGTHRCPNDEPHVNAHGDERTMYAVQLWGVFRERDDALLQLVLSPDEVHIAGGMLIGWDAGHGEVTVRPVRAARLRWSVK